MSRKNITADVRGASAFDYEGTTQLTIKMTHDQARLFRALLSQGTKASEGEVENLFRGIKNKLTHVVDWQRTVTASGAKVAPIKVVPTTPGTVFKARVERGYSSYEGDVFVADAGYGSVRYVTAKPVGGVYDHSKSRISAVL